MKKIESCLVGVEEMRAVVLYEFDGDCLLLLLPRNRYEIPCLQIAERNIAGKLRESKQGWINIENGADVAVISKELDSVYKSHLSPKKKAKKNAK